MIDAIKKSNAGLIAEELARVRARAGLINFKSYYKPNEIAPEFHRYIGSRLDALLNREVKRLIVILRPGFAKSDLGSRYFPAFAFGTDPSEKIIGCSYGDDLATSMNRDLQRIMLDEKYNQVFPSVSLGAENVRTLAVKPLLNSSEFDVMQYDNGTTERVGNYRTASVGGNITGRRFSIGIIDDPIRGAADAESPVKREWVWNWYLQDFYTRALPEARILIIGTRWHEDDLIGRLLKKAKEDPKADQWEVVHYPWMMESWMESRPYDNRKAGELLWLERYGYDEYEKVRAGDDYTFSALYQGYPTSRSGNAIRREWFEDGTPTKYCMFFNPEDVLQVRLAYDVAFTDSQDGDWTWGSLKAKMKDGTFLTLWQHFGHWSNEKRRANIGAFGLQVKAMMEKLFPNAKWKLTEEAGVGPGVNVTREDINHLISLGLPASTFEIKKQAKATRAIAWLSACEARRTKFYAGSQLSEFGMSNGTELWINHFMNFALRLRYSEDGLEFKGGKDDMVDAEVEAHEGLTRPEFIALQSPVLFY